MKKNSKLTDQSRDTFLGILLLLILILSIWAVRNNPFDSMKNLGSLQQPEKNSYAQVSHSTTKAKISTEKTMRINDDSGVGKVNVFDVYPGFDGKIITSVASDQEVKLLKTVKAANGQRYSQISANGSIGWVMNDSLKRN